MSGAGEDSRARAVRALGSHTDGHAAMVAALLYIGDAIARVADRIPEVTHAVEQLIPEEDR